ncbi:MAG: GNAT family N-acetyltransferase [Kofleriaceae bacterium]
MDLQERITEACLAPVGSMLPTRDMRVIEREGWYQLITPSSGSAIGNEVVHTQIAAADAEAVIDRTVEEYRALGLPFKWFVGPLTEPANLGELLAARGFDPSPLRGMAIDPRAWTTPPSPDGVTVEHVTRDSLSDYCAAWWRGWDMVIPDVPAWKDDHLRAIASGRFRLFLARVNGEPAGTAGYIVKSRSVYLVGGNVLTSHRGRGIYRALLDARLQQAAAANIALATTHAREATSAPILERLGFETLFRAQIYRSQPWPS